MTEEQIKFLCKYCVENGNRPLTKEQKEILKQAIDNAKNMDELFNIAFSSYFMK